MCHFYDGNSIKLFPVLIQCENGEKKYFDGADISFDSNELCFRSPSLDVIGVLTLCECGIIFVADEADELTDIDAEIGDNIMDFAANNKNNTIRHLYWGFLDIAGRY